MQETKEGMANIRVLEGVFFNPKMRKLRDISVMFLDTVFEGKKFALLDCTAATGIRGIRYKLEAGAGDVSFLDINAKAAENTAMNVALNSINANVANMSVQEFANTSSERFDAIDIDPFGSAAPYVYDIMKVAKDKGVIMITATDTAVLCGAHRPACIKTYAAEPMHNELCHEAGIRILAAFVAKAAAQFNYGIRVLLSIADMHYVRLFIMLEHGAAPAVKSLGQIGYAAYCNKCHNFHHAKGISPRMADTCDYCGYKMETSGPLWLGNLYEKTVLKKMIEEYKDRKGFEDALEFVESAYEDIDVPFAYSVPKITKYLHISSVAPSKVIKLLSEGSEASKTPLCEDCIKTTANISTVVNAVKAAAIYR